VLPEAHDLADPERYGRPRREALALLDAIPLAHIDVYEAFRRDPDLGSLFLDADSIHFSPRGHERAAALLREWLAAASAHARVAGAAAP
jgi:hypothetical protein